MAPAAAISFVDRPFACPPDIVLDLPAPPSVNRVWMRAKAGKRHVFSAPAYVKWKRASDNLIGSLAQLRGVKPLPGCFEATIILSEKHTRIDLDNSAKSVLDYAVRACLVVDDGPKYMRRLLLEWGTAPHGCRLILRPVEAR